MINSIALTRKTHKSQSGFNLIALISLARQRRTLAALDDHILCDIGVSRAQAEAEADRPVWDAPCNWKA